MLNIYYVIILEMPADDLWRGVTAVSNAGKKRGRGKGSGKKIAKDLNRGQMIGFGKKNMLWPGLNAPIIRGKELLKQKALPEDSSFIEREKNILKLRDSIGGFRVMKINPIDRGWSGTKMAGRSIGSPDPAGDETFDGFDTRVLENKIVFIMKGNMGRRRRFSVMSVTGNGCGLAGFTTAKAPDMRSALRKSKNRASQKLMCFELCENRTVFHDFFCAFGKTKIFVFKKPEGYGLVCHRAIQTICKVVGIKDLHAKIEGSTNLQHIVKAFFIGLLKQKTHNQLAEEKQMHLVEFNTLQKNFPCVVASPTICRKETGIKKDETMNFTQYVLGDKIVLNKKKFPPFYANSIGYQLFLKKQERFRNQNKVRLEMLAQAGQLTSFLAKKENTDI
uniref:Small ribosomal subunit protein uS5m n=1 Tax=Glossina brevipalpis TaxID=37001 RepID=A0A1A9W3L3_9MUSC